MSENVRRRYECVACGGRGWFLQYEWSVPFGMNMSPNPANTCMSCMGKGYQEVCKSIQGVKAA